MHINSLNKQFLNWNSVGTRSVPSLFFIFNSWFLISTRLLRNGCIFACSTAGSNAVIGVKNSDYETVP